MNYTFSTDDAAEAAHMMKRHAAFQAIGEIYATARNQIKHAEPDSDRAALEAIKVLASEAMELVK
jgi:hypothetical protein